MGNDWWANIPHPDEIPVQPKLLLWKIKASLSDAKSTAYVAAGHVQDWPCYKYLNWENQQGERMFIRDNTIPLPSKDPAAFLSLPMCAKEVGVALACVRCTNQFACLAGQVGKMTSETLMIE